MEDIKWKYVLLGAVLTIFAQLGAWFQHNFQFKYPKYDETWWGWYVLALPLTYVFVTATKYNVLGYGGSVWIFDDAFPLTRNCLFNPATVLVEAEYSKIRNSQILHEYLYQCP